METNQSGPNPRHSPGYVPREALLLLKGEETEERSGRMEGKDETRGSLIDDRHLRLVFYLSSAQRVVTASAQSPAHQDDMGPRTHTKRPARGLGTPERGGCLGNVQLRLAKWQGRQRAWLNILCPARSWWVQG